MLPKAGKTVGVERVLKLILKERFPRLFKGDWNVNCSLCVFRQ